jgi:tetratricopeptide (TPR) repeat protein
MGSRHLNLPAFGLVILGALAVAPGPAAADAEVHQAPTGHAQVAATAHAPVFDVPHDPDADQASGDWAETAGDSLDPWTRWFDALEQASAAADPRLYPLDIPSEAPHQARPYRHLAIAKAVTQLERAGAPAGDQDGRRHDGHHDGHGSGAPAAGSPLLALANARNYLNLSEYENAVEWYATAGARDGDGHFRRETGREALAAAICARDTVAVGRALAATMAASDLAGREAEYVLAMRWLLGRRDGTTLSWFVDRARAPELANDLRVAFWRAYALSWLERRDEALAELDRLLAMGGREQVLGARERGWVLTAWTDLTLLGGNHREAERRYRQLAASGMPAVRDWGRLQAAGLALVANRYGEAAAGYREICQAETKGVWTDHACAMAEMAGRLDRLLNEGERYGAAAHYGH